MRERVARDKRARERTNRSYREIGKIMVFELVCVSQQAGCVEHYEYMFSFNKDVLPLLTVSPGYSYPSGGSELSSDRPRGSEKKRKD